MSRPFITDGPDENQVRIIGVELAARNENGYEQELKMFQTEITINREPGPQWRRPIGLRVTVHTSNGDVTMVGQIQ